MDAWAKQLGGASYVDDALALASSLASKEFKNLTIGVLPSAAFPTGSEVEKNASSELRVSNWRPAELMIAMGLLHGHAP